MSEKVLITGGAGFIGSYIARNLLERGHQPIIFDCFLQVMSPLGKDYVDFRPDRFKGVLDRVIIERGNALYPGVVYDVLERHKPDRIVHLAALPVAKVQNLTFDEAFEGSVKTTINILEQLNNLGRRTGHKVKRFLYTSSSMTYGDFQQFPASESHPQNPKEFYGIAKKLGEQVTIDLGRLFDIPYTIIRPSAVYGPYDMNLRVSQVFIEKAIKGNVLVVEGGDEKLDFSYVTDVAEGFVLALFSENGVNEIFNITNGHEKGLLEFVQILQEFFPDLEYEVRERDSVRPKRGTLDITKARTLLEYSPRVGLREGIRQYLNSRGVIND